MSSQILESILRFTLNRFHPFDSFILTRFIIFISTAHLEIHLSCWSRLIWLCLWLASFTSLAEDSYVGLTSYREMKERLPFCFKLLCIDSRNFAVFISSVYLLRESRSAYDLTAKRLPKGCQFNTKNLLIIPSVRHVSIQWRITTFNIWIFRPLQTWYSKNSL